MTQMTNRGDLNCRRTRGIRLHSRILWLALAALIFFQVPASAQRRCGCPRPGWGTNSFRAYLLFGGRLAPVVVDDENGVAVFGGDVYLGPSKKLREDAALIERAGGVDAVNKDKSLVPDSVRNGNRPWPNQVVPYSGVNSLRQPFRREFIAAMDHWERLLGGDIDFRQARRGDVRRMRVIVVPGAKCSWSANTNTLRLAGARSGQCSRHEIGHALGLAHEHMRHDRDTFVTVNWGNIQPSSCSQFSQLEEWLSVGDYDLSSVMHYFATGSSCNGRATLTAVRPGEIGRRFDQITAGDVAGVRRAQGVNPPPR